MKVRFGFVSNSSSSSYTCDFCSRNESGYDLCLSEAGMVECVHNHTFCEDHQIIAFDVEKTLAEKREILVKDPVCEIDSNTDDGTIEGMLLW